MGRTRTSVMVIFYFATKYFEKLSRNKLSSSIKLAFSLTGRRWSNKRCQLHLDYNWISGAPFWHASGLARIYFWKVLIACHFALRAIFKTSSSLNLFCQVGWWWKMLINVNVKTFVVHAVIVHIQASAQMCIFMVTQSLVI